MIAVPPADFASSYSGYNKFPYLDFEHGLGQWKAHMPLALGTSRRLLIIEAADSSACEWSGSSLLIVNPVGLFSGCSEGGEQGGHALMAA